MKESYKFLLHALKPFRAQFVVVLLALIVSASSVLVLGQGLKFLIDQGFAQKDPKILDKGLLFLFAIIFCLAFASFVRSSLIYIVCEKLVANLRRELFSKMIYVSPSYYESHKTSDIFSRLSNDTSILTSLIPNVTSVLLRHIITTFGAFIFLIMTSTKLTLYVLLIIPIAVFPIIILGKKVRQFAKESQEYIAGVGEKIEESFNNVKIIQSYNRQIFAIEKFQNEVNLALGSSKKRIVSRSFLAAMVICLVFSAIAFVLWVGGNDVISGKISAGELSSFIFYAILLAGSVASLTEIFGDVQRVFASCDRLFELSEVESEIKDPANPRPLEDFAGLEFVNCSFAYESFKERKVLDNFSLKINEGEKIAIVGPSGAGKTSLIELLQRFYDVDQGEIKISDVNIKNVKLFDLRKHMAVVSQDMVIFSGSIYENIFYGNLNATKEQVIEAAKNANAHEFIEKLPQGYDTFVGEKGIRLSGGQKQRVIIARALLKDAPVLLLDEATSALDSVNEELVQNAIEKLMENKTCIIISHRLSTIKNADKIIVIDEGKLVQEGTNSELMSQKGLYFDFAKKQIQN